MALGIFQGFFYPCTHTILSKWAHPSERGRLASITYTGAHIGTVLILAPSGLIASSFLGWPGIFYCSGGACLLWSIAFFIFGANGPATCRNISFEERSFIESVLGSSEVKYPVPWKQIFTSKPFLSLIIVHSAHSYGYWTLLTKIPAYLNQAFNYDIKTVIGLYFNLFIRYPVLNQQPSFLINLVFSFFFFWLIERIAFGAAVSGAHHFGDCVQFHVGFHYQSWILIN